MRIACLGEAMVEIAPAGGDPDLARIGVAGDSYNTAIYLARALGPGAVAYVTALGCDAMSDRIAHSLEDEGIATDLVERRAGRAPGLYLISLDAAGERSFSYWRSASAARSLFQAPCRVAPADMAPAEMIYLSGISVAILPPATRDALKAWIDDYRSGSGLVAFDSNYRPALWEDVQTARAETMAWWARCDVALPSVDDEMALFGEATEDAVVDRLRGAGVVRGALKRGATGPLALDGSGHALAVEPVSPVVDTTAAGDSFNAGYLAGSLAGHDVMRCMAEGHALSARVIGHRGAILPRNP